MAAAFQANAFQSNAFQAGHALTAVGITAPAATLGTPAITQINALTATGITAPVTTLGTPTLAQVNPLAAVGITTPVAQLGTPAIAQSNALTAVGITAPVATLGTSALAQRQALVAQGVTTPTALLGTPALAQRNALTATGLTTPTTLLGTPTLGTTQPPQNLTAVGVTTPVTTLGSPSLGQLPGLVAVGITAPAALLGTPSLAQRQALAAVGLTLPVALLGTPSLQQGPPEAHHLVASGITAPVVLFGQAVIQQCRPDACTSINNRINVVWPARPAPKLPDRDAREYALERLRDFFCALDFQRSGPNGTTTAFRLPHSSVHIYQPDDISKAVMPGIGIVPSVGVHETYGLGPGEVLEATYGIAGPGTALMRQSDYIETLTVEVWGSKQSERRALVAGLKAMFRLSDSSYALQLRLPRYYDQVATYELDMSQYTDGDEVTRNRRRAQLMVKLTVPEVVLVNVNRHKLTTVEVLVTETKLADIACCSVDSTPSCSC